MVIKKLCNLFLLIYTLLWLIVFAVWKHARPCGSMQSHVEACKIMWKHAKYVWKQMVTAKYKAKNNKIT